MDLPRVLVETSAPEWPGGIRTPCGDCGATDAVTEDGRCWPCERASGRWTRPSKEDT
jgi:hypothetical protein